MTVSLALLPLLAVFAIAPYHAHWMHTVLVSLSIKSDYSGSMSILRSMVQVHFELKISLEPCQCIFFLKFSCVICHNNGDLIPHYFPSH